MNKHLEREMLSKELDEVKSELSKLKPNAQGILSERQSQHHIRLAVLGSIIGFLSN